MALKILKHSSWKRAIAADKSTAFIEIVPALVLYENWDLADFPVAYASLALLTKKVNSAGSLESAHAVKLK